MRLPCSLLGHDDEVPLDQRAAVACRHCGGRAPSWSQFGRQLGAPSDIEPTGGPAAVRLRPQRGAATLSGGDTLGGGDTLTP